MDFVVVRQIGKVHFRDELLIRRPARVGACRVSLTGIQRSASDGSSGGDFLSEGKTMHVFLRVFVCVCE